MAKLQAGYLFPEITKRKKAFLERVPDAQIISLGIGDTTEPLTPHIAQGLRAQVDALATKEGYAGYVEEQGIPELRKKIADVVYKGKVTPEEVFVSDGAKCDCGRLSVLFGNASVAVQDPAYPVYVDSSVIIGATKAYDTTQGFFEGITYLPCTAENGFFPDLSHTPRTDLIYFCSPNNPTGAVATREQLQELVRFAQERRSIIIFDAAYSAFITEPDLPRSIFEIEGARDVALEINSFSKPIGFTGVRLGWTVVPQTLLFEDGTPVVKDWNRIMTTVFNGASRIVQHGGLAALETEGQREMQESVAYYMENARIIKETLDNLHITNYGGHNAPYIWATFPGEKSWDVFAKILEGAQIVTTPGSGFGPAGEGYIRFSAFGHRENVQKATERLKMLFSA